MTEEQLPATEHILNNLPYQVHHYKISEEEYSKTFLIYSMGKLSLLPELYKIMPLKIIMNLFYLYAGKSFNIPDSNSVKQSIRDIDIYYSLVNNPTVTEINKLATIYSTSPQNIKWISEKVALSLDKPAPI